jgi:hypothetical protein
VWLRLGGESRWVLGLVFIVAAAGIAALIIGSAVGVPVSQVYAGYMRTILVMAPVAALLMLVPITLAAMIRGVERPLARCIEHFRSGDGVLDGAIGVFGPILLMPLLMGAFGTFKQIMPLVAPFTWDDRIAAVGQLLFLGYRPWQVTHALFGTPLATEFLNGIYFIWLPLLFFSVFGFAALAPRYLRARFFVAYFTAWLLLGVVAAYLLSSAGPCYAAMIGASSDFGPLMDRLHAIDQGGQMLGTMKWQVELWKAYSEHRYGFGYGISAMPSMHNAIAFLYVLAASRASIIIRAVTWLFASAILVGSVHLGWHYLADGLVAWIAMAGVWWLAGRYLEWVGYVQPAIEAAQMPEPLIV